MMSQIYTKNQLLEKGLNPDNFYSLKFFGLLTYADSKDVYGKLLQSYTHNIEEVIKIYFIWIKGMFVNIATKNEQLSVLDRRFLSRIINKMYQENRIFVIPCYSRKNFDFYLSFITIENYDEFNRIKDVLINNLFTNYELNAFDYSKSIFNGTKGSVYWIKIIFDHLVFLGYATSVNENSIKIAFNKEWLCNE